MAAYCFQNKEGSVSSNKSATEIENIFLYCTESFVEGSSLYCTESFVEGCLRDQTSFACWHILH